MSLTNNPIIKPKAGLLAFAEELRNVSKACKTMRVSRDTLYRYQELVETNGLEALINQDRGVSNFKNRVDEATEQAVLAYAVEYSAHGRIEPATNYAKAGFGENDSVWQKPEPNSNLTDIQSNRVTVRSGLNDYMLSTQRTSRVL